MPPSPGATRRLALPLAVVAAVMALPAWGLWTNPGPPMEEGFMLVFPERVLAGDVPNRDFLHLYGPGSLWVLAAAYWAFGTSLAVQRIVGILQIVGLVAAIGALLRPWGRAAAVSGAVTATLVIITPTGFTAMAWVGGVALGLWSVWAGVEAVEAPAGSARRRRLALACGALAGLALLYRLDLVVAVGLALVLVLRSLDGPARRRLLVGAVAGASPYLVHLATAGVGAVARGMVLEPVFDLRGGAPCRCHHPPPASTGSSSVPGSCRRCARPTRSPRPAAPCR